MTRLGSTKVSSGEYSPWRIQGDDVIKGLILARDAGAGLGGGARSCSGGVGKIKCGVEPHVGAGRVLGGDKSGLHKSCAPVLGWHHHRFFASVSYSG